MDNSNFLDKELLDDFVAEAKEHLENAERLLLQLETGGGDRRDLVDNLFRTIHSIKGAAGFLNLAAVSSLSHAMESLLSQIRSGELDASPEAMDSLLKGVDLLKAMVDAPAQCDSVPCGDLVARLDALGVPSALPTIAAAPVQAARFALTPATLAKCGLGTASFYELKLALPEAELAKVRGELGQLGEILDTAELVDGVALLFATILERDMVELALAGKYVHIAELRQNLPTPPAPPPPLRAPEPKNLPSPRETTVRINVAVLDHLMTLAGELVLVRNQHLRRFNGGDPAAQEISRRFNAVTSELQGTIMGIRMQPVGNVFGKLPRLVRELSKRLGKPMELELSGEEVELDKSVLESLADPLTHLVRNSCDHGIEDVPGRAAAGKDPVGRIAVNARHESGQIVVSISDDGRGINPDIIRAKALEKGLKTEAELRRMSQKQILGLIMAPGFSTAAAVSDISGRGVGMDVVKTAVEKLGGTLDIESIPGSGSSITLSLPLTLAIISSLLIRCRGQRFAVPRLNMEEVVTLFDAQIHERVENFNGQEVFRHHGKLLQLVRLDEVLGSPTPLSDQDRKRVAETRARTGRGERRAGLETLDIAVVKVGQRRYGLAVDEVLGSEEIVVKPTHPGLGPLPCYLGAAILGDGQVAMILDIDGVGRHALGQIHKHVEPEAEPELVVRSDDAQRVLLFRNGPSEQFALSLALIKRVDWVDPAKIERVGDRQFLNVDGVPTRIVSLDQALRVSPRPPGGDLFLILPKHLKRPFGILASEFSAVEDAVANFHNNTYAEDGVLGASVINGRMTIFPDIYRVIEKIEPEWFGADGHAPRSAPPGDVKILLAEDTPFFRQLVRRYLESDNYHVTITVNGREALERLKVEDFDLVLSDLEMPLMNGWQFIESYKAIPEKRHIPAIALTSLDSERDRAAALKSGFADYIVKIERERFLGQIADFLSANRRDV